LARSSDLILTSKAHIEFLEDVREVREKLKRLERSGKKERFATRRISYHQVSLMERVRSAFA
jgi:hypothetical protein